MDLPDRTFADYVFLAAPDWLPRSQKLAVAIRKFVRSVRKHMRIWAAIGGLLAAGSFYIPELLCLAAPS